MNKAYQLVSGGKQPLVSVSADTTAVPQLAGGLYEPQAVQRLFDSMAVTYRWHSVLTGGLTGWWRRQLASRLPLQTGQRVVDLMTGTGELWPQLLPALGPTGRVRAVDFSRPMLAAAARRRAALAIPGQVSLHQAGACSCGLRTGSADVVVSAFGVKTLAQATYPALGAEIARLLAPGGTVALLELTIPARGWRRLMCLGYLWNLNHLLRFLGGPITAHTHLLPYARQCPDLEAMAAACRAAGLINVRTERLFPGLASVLLAQQPGLPASAG
ncbi:class I SAM-dependent methyltransferase [Hymenobacter glacieicola]|uniref:Demethylmenaquinone methyltransferase n=1 Tax=Hymenobacter glacieicola TaxID=1562124 RepID=A0ABQ1X0V0_9BACT|nr:class I SAM-dependent methyltransferase [Hymenobacter glacieicola]GGG54393.1 demethylmenaquinone methyltransferase [Hymenobacter glacieicola]